MKKILFLAMFVVVHAQACPNLSGDYSVCRSKQNILIESTDMKAIQVTQNSITTYTFDSLPDGENQREIVTLMASGQSIKKSWITSTGEHFESTITAQCLGDSIKLQSSTTSDGRNWMTESSIIRKIGNTLVKTSTGVVGEMKFVDTLTCY